jgi:hypothetical protein
MRYVKLIEENNIIYATQCGNERYAFCLGKNRPSRLLDAPNGFIAVEGHNKYVSKGASCLEVSQVSDMQNIEASVSQNHFLSREK